jgi:hypothetical protein
VLGAPIGLCSEEHEVISTEGPFSGSIICTVHRWIQTCESNVQGYTVVLKRHITVLYPARTQNRGLKIRKLVKYNRLM